VRHRDVAFVFRELLQIGRTERQKQRPHVLNVPTSYTHVLHVSASYPRLIMTKELYYCRMKKVDDQKKCRF